ncbi:glycoside hydrolase family 13 protein [Roseateles sp.]|uniref:glycoside hydrolase family 13 protein n=1 Tax=Roseateles sp. TaxID=1971397 RepID=UPI003D137EE1
MKNTRLMMFWWAAAACVLSTSVHALELERVEPPNWWVGMKHEQVELMLHGSAIADWTPSLSWPGVRLVSSTRGPNPNYLWVTLQVGAQARAGVMKLTLRRGAEEANLSYELRERAPGSAARQGFGPADVILNLMPDRFVNGDPGNDNMAGSIEQANRKLPGGRHGGDLAGMIRSLDHIATMGYTAIWSTPLTESNQPSFSYHGYGTTDAYRIDLRYGSNADYQRFVALARAKGLKVIQDLVPNHIGSNHWWMKDLPAPDWLSNNNQFVPTNHARTTVSDPYASAYDLEHFSAGWFDTTLPDKNQRNPQLANYEIQNAIWWIEFAGLSGLRVDTYAYSDPAFINEWTRRILAEYPALNIVGEEWSDNPAVQAYWARGRTQSNGFTSTLPSVMDYVVYTPLAQSLAEPETYSTGLKKLYNLLVSDQLYADPGRLVLFDGNHDTPRIFSALDEDPALTRMALAYVLTMKRIPQLYYGTEVLMTSPKALNAFDAFRDDFPGGWAGDTVNAFTGSGLKPEQVQMQTWLRKLLNWRKTARVVHEGRLMHFFPEDGAYVLFRYDERDTVMLVLNKNSTATKLGTERFRERLPLGVKARDVMTGQQVVIGAQLELPPRSVTLLQLQTAP